MNIPNVLSGALVVVTLIYAWLTWRISDASRRAADASRDAADSARTAAEAARASAVVAESSLHVAFDVTLDRQAGQRVWFTLIPSVNLWLHSVHLDCTVLAESDHVSGSNQVSELSTPHGAQFPILVYGGSEGTSLEWSRASYGDDDHGIFGFLSIEYSLSEESPVRLRQAYFESKEGLGVETLRALGIKEKRREAGDGKAEPRS